MKSRKYYETWVSNRVNRYRVFIQKIPYCNFYHFYIEFNYNIIYQSLLDNNIFETFDKCKVIAEQWVKDKMKED